MYIITSTVFELGFLEFIVLFAIISSDLILLKLLNVLITKSTLALLIKNFIFFLSKFIISLNNTLCVFKSNPSDVYPTNDLLFSGAYGGSKYTKSPFLIFLIESIKLL